MQSWGYLSGLLRSERRYLLSGSDFLAYAEAASLDALQKMLDDGAYATFFMDRNLKEFSEVFTEFYDAKFQNIKKMSPSSLILNLHMFKHDLNNFKLCYKARIAQHEVIWDQLSHSGTISPDDMHRIVENELWNELPQIVSQAVIMLEEQSYGADGRQIDFFLDKAYYTHRIFMLEEATKDKPNLYADILKFYRQEVDCENIKNFLRAKKMDLSREQVADIMISRGYMSVDFFKDNASLSKDDVVDLISDSIYGDIFVAGLEFWKNHYSCTLLEKEIDEFLLEKARNFAYFSFGPAVVEEALRSLSMEIKNLKLIIIGKMNGMEVEQIKERIRDVRA